MGSNIALLCTSTTKSPQDQNVQSGTKSSRKHRNDTGDQPREMASPQVVRRSLVRKVELFVGYAIAASKLYKQLPGTALEDEFFGTRGAL